MALSIATVNCNGMRDYNVKKNIMDVANYKSFDILFLQETHINNMFFAKKYEKLFNANGWWSFSINVTGGVGILIKCDLVYDLISFQHDSEGRYIVVDIDINNYKLRLINVYVHNKPSDRREFITNLHYIVNTRRQVVMGGDFNFVENVALDKLGGLIETGEYGKDEINNLKDDFDLYDPFRKLYPTDRVFTFFNNCINNPIYCRLDRFYTNKLLYSVIENVIVHVCSVSDHDFVELKFKNFNNADLTYGPGYWKLNTSILFDLNTKFHIIDIYNNEFKNVEVKDVFWWEHFKARCKTIFIKRSRERAVKRRKEILDLEKELAFFQRLNVNCLNHGQYTTEIVFYKDKIKELLNDKGEGAKIRARIQFIEETEKSSRYFLRKERQNAKKKLISHFINEKGTETRKEDTLDFVVNYYQSLYSLKPIDDRLADDFLTILPKLDKDQMNKCEGMIKYHECELAISLLNNNKTPGSDGLPKEFYSMYLEVMGQGFVEMLNNCLKFGLLSESQRLGLITLLCKNFDFFHYLNYWRPISLLNVDYKILAKVLSLRLRSVLPHIINIDQTCSILRRSITDSIILLRNIFDFIEQKNIPSVVLCLDQAKAFDRVSHDFLFKVLNAYGFGSSFTSWVKLLYTNTSSSILFNGHISTPFKIRSGVRQGCPLSPLLYVLCIEPFGCHIRCSPLITGLSLPGSKETVKVIQYADDTTLILTNKYSINNAFAIADTYCKVSGAKLNKEKCKGIWLGAWKFCQDKPHDIQWVNELKILGIKYGQGDFLYNNIQPVLESIRTSLDLALGRNFSFRGKAIFTNVMALSKFGYIIHVVSLPTVFAKQLNKCIFQFVWSKKGERLSRATLYLNTCEGGIGLHDIVTRVKAYMVMHIIKLFTTDCKWKHFVLYWVGIHLKKYYTFSNNSPHSFDMPQYYVECLKQFKEFMKDNPDFQFATASLKTVYILLRKKVAIIARVVNLHPSIDFNIVWKSCHNKFISPEVRNLSFQIAHDIVATNMRLWTINITNDKDCTLCKASIEFMDHLFVKCKFVKSLWMWLEDLFYKTCNHRLKITPELVLYKQFMKLDKLSIFEKDLILLLISELVYTIWVHRLNVKYDKAKSSTEVIQSMFRKRLATRIRVDYQRFNEIDFDLRWCRNNVIASIDAENYKLLI